MGVSVFPLKSVFLCLVIKRIFFLINLTLSGEKKGRSIVWMEVAAGGDNWAIVGL